MEKGLTTRCEMQKGVLRSNVHNMKRLIVLIEVRGRCETILVRISEIETDT